MTDAELEQGITELGTRLWQHSQQRRGARRVVEDHAMAAMTAEPGLRAAAFRLVDVAPACSGPAELSAHLAAYLEQIPQPPRLASAAAGVLRRRPGAFAGARVTSLAVRTMADRFIVGETISDAEPALAEMWTAGIANTVDLLGEATVTGAEGDRYADRCRMTLESLVSASTRWPSRPLLERDGAGLVPRVNLSVKVTAMTPLVRAHAPQRARADAERHLLTLLRSARDAGAHLHVDMESLNSRELILELVLELLSREEFRDGPSAGLVMQAYLRDAEEVLQHVLEWARGASRSVPLTLRLVKGAYWDHEMIEAAQHGWASPVWSEKLESDRCYERMTRAMVDAFPLVRPAIASHNLRSVAHAVVYARSRGLTNSDIELQVLRGLGDDLQRALAAEGLRCRTYCPVGDMVAGMAYLVRRLLENTANDSFLTSQAAGVDIDQLLRAP